MNKIYIDNGEDRLSMVSILAKNGYTVRIGKEKVEGKTNYRYYIEYWQ